MKLTKDVSWKFHKNIGKKYSKLEFSGIAFDSRKVKKIIFFCQLMEIN